MTQNEKRVLIKFNKIKEGNTVSMAGTLRVTISYAYDVCKKLCERGYLEQLSPGRFALYRITSSGEEQVKPDVQTKEEETIERSEGVLQASEQSKEVPQPALQGSERSEKNVLDEPSVPEEWKTCNWKWE